MKSYIEKSLHCPVIIKENSELLNRLPMRFQGYYKLYNVNQNGVEWMIASPLAPIRLNQLRRDHNQIEKASGINCALCFKRISPYSKDVLMREGIPFIIIDSQVFLPFLGMLLSEKNTRRLKPIRQISFLTQKLILKAIYEKWNDINATEIAKELGVTKMSVSRCFDEIEYLDIDILDLSGKTRKVLINEEVKTLLKKIKSNLRSPVIERYLFARDIKLENKAGISALSEYSMLSDNHYPTYGITKKEMQGLRIASIQQASKEEEIGCEVLELGYFIDFQNQKVQDPVSVALSLSDEDKEDERVQICIDAMMEEYVW